MELLISCYIILYYTLLSYFILYYIVYHRIKPYAIILYDLYDNYIIALSAAAAG